MSNTTPPNPPADDAMPQPGRALTIARIVIAAGLLIGVGVFGVYAIQELSKPVARADRPDNNFNTADQLPNTRDAPAIGKDGKLSPKDLARSGRNPLLGQPIDRANPHPAEIEPFGGRATKIAEPVLKPPVNGLLMEECAYKTADATVDDIIDHYHRAALAKGMTLESRKTLDGRFKDSAKATWKQGNKTLELVVLPLPPKPVPAPQYQPMPKRWMLVYIYPDNSKKN